MGNRYFFASPELRSELPDDPEILLKDAVTVKQNPVRDVRFNSGYFIKTDRRRFHGFKGEFNAAMKLSASGISTVEHLAYGRCQAGNILITRAFENSFSVSEYLEKHGADDRFLTVWKDFLMQWNNSGFHHPDPHAGNVLYRPADGRLTLVDLHGIRRKCFLKKLQHHKLQPDTAKFIHALHGFVPQNILLGMLASSGAADPEKELKKLHSGMVGTLLAEWPRRRRQLFAAYPKFSRRDRSMLISAAFKGELDPAAFETAADARARMSASLFLKLLRIPHRRVMAADFAASLICYEKLPAENFCSDHPEIAGFNLIFELCGLPIPRPEHWVVRGTLPLLYHLDDIITSPLFSTGKD